MQRLNDKQYNKQKLKELERLKKKGNLDENMKPFYRWLKGDRRRKRDYTYHRKCHKIILESDLTLEQMHEQTENISMSCIKKLSSGEFACITEDYAAKAYYQLQCLN